MGESARSIYERASEHRKDAEDNSEDSHMVKHWRISHPELPIYPAFKFKVIGSYRDALSRQVAEAVRIELRGEVLNSKSEFNRCKLPRLTINRDDWLFKQVPANIIANPNAEVLREEFPAEGGGFNDELGESALWNLGAKKKATKRKKEKEVKADTGTRKKKKVKLDRLENWGEADAESEADVRSWLVKPVETPGPSKRMRQMEMEFGKVGVINLLITPKPNLAQGGQDEDINPEADKLPNLTKLPTPKLSKKGGKKLPKKESLALIRKTNTKISGWLTTSSKPETMEDDWSDDISVPEIKATEDIERMEYAKMKAEAWKGRRI